MYFLDLLLPFMVTKDLQRTNTGEVPLIEFLILNIKSVTGVVKGLVDSRL